MDCKIIRDLIPLYIDRCCSDESEKIVKEHLSVCDDCKKLLEDMQAPYETISETEAPKKFTKLNDLKASVLQTVLLFISFGLITIGVALESIFASGDSNGFWALSLIIPATGFMLSMANWYFVRIYKSRKIFSIVSLIATIAITLCADIGSVFYYKINLIELFSDITNFIVITLTVAFCILSKILSNRYAKMLGKE